MRTSILAWTAALLALYACGGDKYADVRAVYKDLVQVQEEYVEAMEKVEDAEGMARAIDDFGEAMEKVRDRLEEAEAKHPEIRNPNTVPSSLREEYAKREAMAKKIIEVSLRQKNLKLAMDPKVIEANRRLAARMKKGKD